ncbi:MAG TPA: zinc ribbon domain-containing protein [Thermoanaerobaculia bacterium]
MTIVHAPVQRVCTTCGAALSPGARKCSECTSYQGECDACGLPIPENARRCSGCKAFQDGRPCRSCGMAMPASAKRCPECRAFQNWRALVPDNQVVLALLVSLISILSAVAPAAYKAWNNRSNAYVRVIGHTLDNDSNPVLLVLVANDGGRPALVRGAAMAGKGLPIGTTPLTILDPTQELVLPSKSTMLRLTTLDINTPAKRDALLALLPAGEITVTVEVEETGRLGRRVIRQQSDVAKGVQIAELVQKRVLP